MDLNSALSGLAKPSTGKKKKVIDLGKKDIKHPKLFKKAVKAEVKEKKKEDGK